MTCAAKHTKAQIPAKQWRCPRCGVGATIGMHGDGWIIDEMPELADPDCALLHEGDLLACADCGASMSGKAFAARYIKQRGLVKCPTCKGSGHVKGKEGKS